MSAILRRILAFVLGVVIGVSGGLVWAYESFRPMTVVEMTGTDIGMGPELSDYTVEELAELVKRALEAPDQYTFDRLEKEYGLDLAKLLEAVGIKSDDTNSEDWNALKSISLLSIAQGPDKLLDNIKLRALYVLLPSLTGMPLDELLSPEAQVQLGDYTLYELTNSDAATEEVGLITALKGLKVGSLVPKIFDATYDPDKHEYTYKVKDDQPAALKALDLIANVRLKSILDIINGADVMEELFEGGLRPVAEKPFTEILESLLGIAGEDVKNLVGQYIQVLGDLSLADMFERNEDGKYVFKPENIAEKLELGYALGLHKGEDGKWYKDEACTTPAEGILSVIAKADLAGIFDADGDALKIVDAVVGGLSVMDVYRTIIPEGDAPALIEALGDFSVRDVIRGGSDKIVSNLIENLDHYIGDMTLGEAIYDFLPDAAKDFIEGNALLDALMDLKFGDFLKEEYTLDTVLDGIENAVGEVMIGEILGHEKVDGVWQNLEHPLLAVLYDIDMSDIIDIIRSGNVVDAAKSLLGEVTIGQIFGALLDYGITDEDPVYHKGSVHVTDGFNDFLNVPVWKIFTLFEKDSEENFLDDVFALTAGDLLYSLLPAFGIVSENPFAYEDGKVFIKRPGLSGCYLRSCVRISTQMPTSVR